MIKIKFLPEKRIKNPRSGNSFKSDGEKALRVKIQHKKRE